jgi:hypothetical protein
MMMIDGFGGGGGDSENKCERKFAKIRKRHEA